MNNFINNLVVLIKQQRWNLIAGLIGLLVLEVGLMIVEKPKIDFDIAHRASVILKQRGYNRIEVQADGREITLIGAVSSMTAKDFATQFSQNVFGVRSVAVELEITPLRLSHLLISRNLDGVLKLEGEVPTQSLLKQIVEFAKINISHDSVIDRLQVDPEVADPEWADAIKGIMMEGNQLLGMEIEIGAGRLALGGLMGKKSEYRMLIQRIQQLMTIQQLLFVNKIGIKPVADYLVSSGLIDRKSEADFAEKEIVEENNQSESLVDFKDDKTQRQSILQNDMLFDEFQELPVEQSISKPKSRIDLDEEDASYADRVVYVDLASSAKDRGFQLGKCQNQIAASLSSYSIIFPSDSAKISVDNYTSVEDIANILNKCPTYHVLIEGHTDSKGNLVVNKSLSNQRAVSVMQALVKFGVESGRISAKGFGASRPVASNDTEKGRHQNRRIEIILTLEYP